MNRLLSLFLVIFLPVATIGAEQPQSLSPGGDTLIDLSAKGVRIARAAEGHALVPPSAASRAQTVRAYLAATGHRAATLDSLRPVKMNRSLRRPVTHTTYRQEIDGLEVYGTYVKASVDDSGALVSLVENVVPRPTGGVARASISPRDALGAALRTLYPGRWSALLESAAEVSTSGHVTRFAKGGFFYREPTATRVAIPYQNGVREGFLVETWEDASNQLWHTLVGDSGAIVYRELRTNTDTYKIFPDHPGNSTQTTVSGPGSGNAESPSGWVFSNTTTGNNVDAYLDRDNNNSADSGGRPVSSSQSFVATADLTQSPTTTTNQMVAVQNLFYLNNVIHDRLYRHGFTEAAGNFQENNFGQGGSGSDSVNAEAQDGGGTNNANFSTPTDGSNPRMQMYLWNRSTPSRDGDLDSDIVWHEYGHGLTWRMIGSMTGPLAGAIGEGNSDVLAILVNNDDTVGEYSYNTANGIRRYPYTNYPLTYGDVTGSSVHNDGEIYAATMWYLWQLFQEQGLSVDLLFDYMVDGMNYTPARPAYEDMRDGILAAITDPAHECLVWTAFARFGIGVGANGSESCNFIRCTVSITESFAVPAEYANCGGGTPTNTPPSASFTSSVSGLTASFTDTSTDSDGSVVSWSWSFGDGATSTTRNPSHTYAAGGTYTVSLTVTDDDGATSTATGSVTVSSPSGISLAASGYKVRGVHTVDLTWSGATTGTVDIYRDGVRIATTSNDGAFTDNTGRKGGATYTYQVCESPGSACSNTATVNF
jgi:extracellular elastinolytic metalloproteinase